jgi:hypothetical protein
MSGRCAAVQRDRKPGPLMDDRDHRRPHPAVIPLVPRGANESQRAKAPVTLGAGSAHNGAGGHAFAAIWDLRLWTAGLLAALAARPVPSCIFSLARGVNGRVLIDVCLGQTACGCLRSVMGLRPDHQYPARLNELSWNTLRARSRRPPSGNDLVRHWYGLPSRARCRHQRDELVHGPRPDPGGRQVSSARMRRDARKTIFRLSLGCNWHRPRDGGTAGHDCVSCCHPGQQETS